MGINETSVTKRKKAKRKKNQVAVSTPETPKEDDISNAQREIGNENK